jgi:hypothetical protein
MQRTKSEEKDENPDSYSKSARKAEDGELKGIQVVRLLQTGAPISKQSKDKAKQRQKDQRLPKGGALRGCESCKESPSNGKEHEYLEHCVVLG